VSIKFKRFLDVDDSSIATNFSDILRHVLVDFVISKPCFHKERVFLT
jgi:hypothetical protein